MTPRLFKVALLLGLSLLGGLSECDQQLLEGGIMMQDTGTVQWTPNGEDIVFSGAGKIVVVDTAGTRLWVIPQGPSTFLPFLQDDSPRVSPDGASVAYRTYRYREGITREHSFNIAVSDLNGSNHRKLTPSDRSDSHPIWSPDGSKIAYIRGSSQLSPKSESHGIYVADSDGGNHRRIGPPKDPRVGKYLLAWGAWGHAWSTDGEYIVYFESLVTDEGDRHSYVARVRPDGSDYRRIYAFPEQDYSPGPLSFSPSGQQLAFPVQNKEAIGIRTVNLDGSGSFDPFTIPISGVMNAVTRGLMTRRGRQIRYIDHVSWSKDGSEVIFSGISQSPETEFDTHTSGVHAVRKDGSGLRTLVELNVPRSLELWPVSLSPDGSRLAVLRAPWDLIRTSDLGVRHPDDAWYSAQDENVVLYTVSIDGTDKRVLVREVGEVFVPENRARVAGADDPVDINATERR